MQLSREGGKTRGKEESEGEEQGGEQGNERFAEAVEKLVKEANASDERACEASVCESKRGSHRRACEAKPSNRLKRQARSCEAAFARRIASDA